MNQGAAVMMRTFINWKDWSMLIFDVLAALQIWMPHVVTGLITNCLYIRILVLKGSLERNRFF